MHVGVGILTRVSSLSGCHCAKTFSAVILRDNNIIIIMHIILYDKNYIFFDENYNVPNCIQPAARGFANKNVNNIRTYLVVL